MFGVLEGRCIEMHTEIPVTGATLLRVRIIGHDVINNNITIMLAATTTICEHTKEHHSSKGALFMKCVCKTADYCNYVQG
eukprot:12320-Heterococcus_DN1.PRE.6